LLSITISLIVDVPYQSSGVGVNAACIETFQAFKMGKKFKYVIFGVSNDNTEIIVLKTSDSPSYDEFVADLPETDCRWAVYDFEYEKEDGGKRNKICFFSW
jgi:cofilin